MEEGLTEQSKSPAETPDATTAEGGWLDVRSAARLQASSEDPTAPLADAFAAEGGTGWRAAVPGAQTIDVIFDEPRDVSRVRLVFENACSCTHEFTVSWSDSHGQRREIVRQQFNFHEGGAIREVEEYSVELRQAEALHIRIIPDISGAPVLATLRQCRIS
jgi:hypothetical protein